LACLLTTSLTMAQGYASTSDVHSVIVENNDKVDTFSLNTVTTRTEYRTETVQSTCYRQEIIGYRRVCRDDFNFSQIIGSLEPKDVGPHPPPGPHPRDPRDPPPERKPEPRPSPRPDPRPEPRPYPRPDPRPDPRPEPRPYPRPEPRPPVCYDEPIYQEVAYSCLKTISVPYEVVDHESTANVNVKLGAAPQSKPQTGNCGITFSMNGDNFQANNSCLDYLALAQVGKKDNGRIKDLSYTIALLDAEKVFSPLAGGLTNMHLDGDVLVIRTGELRANSNFSLKLYVERKRILKKNDVLINRVLKSSDFTYQPIDSRTGYVRMDLSRLTGNFDNSKKHIIKVNLDLTLPAGTIISGSSMPSTHQEAEVTTP
jgi:hypothetical protein